MVRFKKLLLPISVIYFVLLAQINTVSAQADFIDNDPLVINYLGGSASSYTLTLFNHLKEPLLLRNLGGEASVYSFGLIAQSKVPFLLSNRGGIASSFSSDRLNSLKVPFLLSIRGGYLSTFDENYFGTNLSRYIMHYFGGAGSSSYEANGKNMKFTIDGGEGYRMIGLASDSNIRDLFTDTYTQGFTGSDNPEASFSSIWYYTQYDEQINGPNNWIAPNRTIDTILRGNGFFMYFWDSRSDYPDNDGLPFTYNYFYSENEGDEYAFTFKPLHDNQWHLLGNPKGDIIDFDKLTRQGLRPAVQVYDHTKGLNGDYRSWNGSSGDLYEGYIQPGQAFWTQGLSAADSPELIVKDSAIVHNSNLSQKVEAKKDLSLTLRYKDVIEHHYISFSDDGSDCLDNRDVIQVAPPSPSYLHLVTEVEEERLRVNNLDLYGDKESLVFPLYIDHIQNQQPFKASYVLGIEGDEAFFQAYSFFIVDTKTGIETPLTPDTELAVTTLTGSDAASTVSFKGKASFEKPSLKLAETSSSDRYLLVIHRGTATSVDELDILPKEFALDQNYPNPFNPSTNIQFSLPVAGEVQLNVFSIDGRRVASLLNRRMQAGTHKVVFDGKYLSSGVYLFELQYDGKRQLRKMTLLK